MAIQKTEGVVLRREDVRETSVELTAYTRDFGKLRLLSKGVRNPGERYLSAYELFALDDIVFYEKNKRNLYLLSQCELIDYFPEIRNSFERLSYASYFVELVNSVTAPQDKNRKIFDLLVNSLRLLSSNASPKRVARILEIRLLSILGLMPNLTSCANCGKDAPLGRMRFSFKLGGVLCESCYNLDRNARPILPGTVNFLLRIESLPFEKIKQIKVAKRVGSEVERFLRSFIQYHLDVRLRSREFLNKVGL